MSTLGTFAKFSSEANFARGKKKATTYTVDTSTPPSGMIEMEPAPKAATPAAKPTSMVQYPQGANLPMKSKQRMKGSRLEKLRGIKNRNIMIGSGLGLAGLGTLGAIAYNNRDSKKRADMSANTAFANFVAGTQLELLPSDSTKGKNIAGKKRELTAAELADIKKRSKKGDKVMSAEDIKSTQERLKKYGGQRTVERNIDAGGDVYKGAKGMDYVTRTGALLGSPERNMIAAGKNSKNEFIKGASKVAEKVGRAGYKTGAIGARGVLNKVVGRTLTGKGVRLGAAGLGLSAIGGAMKRNRQENQ